MAKSHLGPGAMVVLLLAGCAHAPSAGVEPQTAAPRLEGTRWRLVDFQSMDDSQGRQAPTDRNRFVITFGADGRAALQVDCNRGSTAWQAEQVGDRGSLTFGPIATTRMACPSPTMAPLIEAQLPYVRSYVLTGGRLHMSLMADGGILTWEPSPPAP
jgi:heat shock protein HslJ